MKKIKKTARSLRKLLCSFTAILLLLGLLGEAYIPPARGEDGTQAETYSLPGNNGKKPSPYEDEIGRD
ncbi:MAG: hypothetical protein K2N63_02155 [Lachnospiraceae bacterium]|nr:hypothetical protein [Lachnospiraceae bacterium]